MRDMMLFVQEITLRYYKDARNAKCAAQRKAVRFCPLPEHTVPAGEVLFQSVFMGQDAKKLRENTHCRKLRTYGAEAFYDGGFNNTPFSGRLAVTKEADTYRIAYCGKRDLGFYSTKFVLSPNEYGRVIFNERGAFDYTGIWYYDLVIYNFVNAEPSACREKLFFRKEPDKSFSDLQWLRYNG